MKTISNDWLEVLSQEFNMEYYLKLSSFLQEEYERSQVFPDVNDIFNSFHYTTLRDVKVVLIGQDPYHNENQAHGLCFSVKQKVEIPPSLVNIFKELKDDIGCYIPNHGELTKWAKQGVLLLNTVLTVRAHEPASHHRKGWEEFTNAALVAVNQLDRPIVIILWGKPAQSKKKLLNNPRHLILEAPHPSPLSSYRGFFGSKPFSQTNDFLCSNHQKPIDWQIENY